MLPPRLRRDEKDIAAMRRIAESGDCPVLMMNINAYRSDAGFPAAGPYRDYLAGLEALVRHCGGEILWRLPVNGQPVGVRAPAEEILAIWYPSHQAYLDLPSAPGGEENYRLRRLCVRSALIYRCPGDAATEPVSASRALVHAFLAAVSAGDLPDALLTEDMTGWITTQGPMTKQAYQGAIRLLARMSAAPLSFTIDAITAEADRAVAEVRSEGRLIDGSAYRNTYVFAFRFRDGRIASVAEHYNALTVQKQLVPLMRALAAEPNP